MSIQRTGGHFGHDVGVVVVQRGDGLAGDGVLPLLRKFAAADRQPVGVLDHLVCFETKRDQPLQLMFSPTSSSPCFPVFKFIYLAAQGLRHDLVAETHSDDAALLGVEVAVFCVVEREAKRRGRHWSAREGCLLGICWLPSSKTYDAVIKLPDEALELLDPGLRLVRARVGPREQEACVCIKKDNEGGAILFTQGAGTRLCVRMRTDEP